MSDTHDRDWRERLAPLAPPRGRPNWAALEARIVERARDWLAGRPRATAWEVLAVWARPGLAVAAGGVLLVLATATLRESEGGATLEDALRPPTAAPSASELLASSEPNAETVARFIFEEAR